MRPYRRHKRFRAILLLIAAALLGMGLVVKLLWNAILPSLLGVNQITYWQSVGLLILSRILFGGFNGGRGGRREWERRWKGKFENEPTGEHPFRQRWMQMNRDERIRFREEIRKRCGNFRKQDK